MYIKHRYIQLHPAEFSLLKNHTYQIPNNQQYNEETTRHVISFNLKAVGIMVLLKSHSVCSIYVALFHYL